MALLVGLCSLLGSVAASKPEHRIIGGSPTSIEEHPWMASVQHSSGSHMCGGSILDESRVLTAAHCVTARLPSEVRVRVGSSWHAHGGRLLSVSGLHVHRGYQRWPHPINDVALLKLESPLSWAPGIGPVKLARAGERPAGGKPTLSTGWGLQGFQGRLSSRLLQIEMRIVGYAECAKAYHGYFEMRGLICAIATNKSECNGDSGGPLLVDGRQVGIVSWGVRCGLDGYPAVYADVAYHRDWIDSDHPWSGTRVPKLFIFLFILLCILIVCVIKYRSNAE